MKDNYCWGVTSRSCRTRYGFSICINFRVTAEVATLPDRGNKVKRAQLGHGAIRKAKFDQNRSAFDQMFCPRKDSQTDRPTDRRVCWQKGSPGICGLTDLVLKRGTYSLLMRAKWAETRLVVVLIDVSIMFQVSWCFHQTGWSVSTRDIHGNWLWKIKCGLPSTMETWL